MSQTDITNDKHEFNDNKLKKKKTTTCIQTIDTLKKTSVPGWYGLNNGI